MKKTKSIIVLCLTMFLFMPIIIKGQITDCSSNYEKALLLYNKGMADSALRVLQPCLDDKKMLKNLSDRTIERIFRLAALSCIMTANPDDAEKYVKKMFEYQPYYKNSNNEDDLMEFRLMLDKFTVVPSLRACISGTIRFPFSDITKQYSNYQVVAGSPSLSGSNGYLFGLSCEMMISKRLSIETGAELGQYNFKYSVTEKPSEQINYSQYVTSIEIPVIARFYVTSGRFKPYIEGGIAGRFLLNSSFKSDDYGKYWLTNSSNSGKILTTFIADIEYVNLVAGAGTAYDFRKFCVRLDIRYIQSFSNKSLISKFDNINGYSDIPPTEKFYYTDDITLISSNILQISLGLLYNLRYKVF
jgi:hypothetical protein